MMLADNETVQEDTLKQRQDDELLCITAIYPNEVKDLRTEKAWNTWKPLELLISVSSDTDSEEDDKLTSQLDLYVRCSVNYPNAVPFIDIKNIKGLSSQDATQLKQNLLAHAKSKMGCEILLDLIQITKTFLYDHKKPHYKSCYEEMVHNQQQQQKQIAEQQLKEEEAEKLAEQQKILAIEQERNRKLEALKIANKKSKTQFDASSPPQKDDKDTNVKAFQRTRSLSESSCKDVCTGTTRTTLKFSSGKKDLSVFCGRCISHSKRGSVAYSGMETTSGDLVLITKWTLQWPGSQKWKAEELENVKKEQSIFLKQLCNLEQEFRTLKQLKHKNIVLYLGLNYVQKKDKIIIFVLQEYVPGCSLSQMAKGTCLSIHQLQLYTRDILHALQYLHENSVVHKNIRDTSIFISRNGQVKLSDYSLDKKIYDMYRSFTKDLEIDYYPPTIGKGGKKSDIYRFGVILLSLSTGHLSRDMPLRIPQSLNPSFQDFLRKCLLHDEQERWSADQLLSHPFVVFSSHQYVAPKECEIKPVINDENDFHEMPLLKGANSSGSRVLSEFKIMECLGKGAFGLVLKVQNKLDSRVYALKRIALNPTNKVLDKKIKREVTVLSRLNHENIVRYYNSWIEETMDTTDIGSDESNCHSSISELSKDLELSATSSLVQWNMHNNNDKDDGSSSDDDDEDYNISFACHQNPVYSNSIVFEDNDENLVWSEESSSAADKSSQDSKPKIQRIMYIQMEFCEKSTLRTAIDDGLYVDVPRLWRLFREIVEGLHHIHLQCVIHRDLKPVNIFLDSQDHVKIGDFGLATDFISKPVAFDKTTTSSVNASVTEPLNQSYYDAPEDGFQTGNVGTALYVAPEVTSENAKLSYTIKVDIYSLGIIFFEMCYPPPVTAMEKGLLIRNLRLPDIVMPPDVEKHLSPEMIHILKWLLQHDHNLRPNSAELIASDYIPPLFMEETDINNIVRNTVANPKSRTYKNMIERLFDQEIPTAFDFTYDIDLYKGQSVKNKSSQIFSNVVSTLNKVLQKHGAVNYSVPTLMPKSTIYNKDTCVHVMDRGGGIVTLPHDLRVPFARHVARRDITHLKRFVLEKVYREQQVFGFHPRQQYEYAFDIVTPTSCNFMPDAEVVSAVSEIISEFQSLEDKGYMVCFNHVSLLKAIILYCGIDESTELKVYERLGSPKNKMASKLQLQQLLIPLQIPERTVAKAVQFLDLNDSPEKVYNLFQPLLQCKGEVGTLAKKAFKDLKSIVKLAAAFGVKLPMFIRPGLAHEIQLFSGVMFQFVCLSKTPKKKANLDILAAGGRYDKLVNSFKVKGMSEGGRVINQSAVGVSIAVERIVAAELESTDFESSAVEFLVHTMEADMSVEKSDLLKELWSLGFSASAFYDKQLNLDNAMDFCRNNSVPNLIIVSRLEPGIIKIRTFEREKMNEKKICFSELKDYLLKFGSSVRNPSENSQGLRMECQRSFSFSSSSSSMSVMSVRFLPQDKTHNNRKREPNIRSHVLATFQPSSNRVWEIIAVDLKMTVIGTIVSLWDINCNTDSIYKTFQTISDSHSKYKKYLSLLAEEICDIRSRKQSSSIILYSLPENNFRVVL